MTNIYLLGATGSIGLQTLDVIRTLKDVKVKSMSCAKNIKKLEELIEEFKPEMVCVEEECDALYLQKKYPNIKFGYGMQGLIDCATYDISNKSENEYLVNAVVGMVGLEPTIRAIENDRSILIANKETLVVGGELIKELLKTHPVKLLPIDSEHSAILQCLQDRSKDEVSKIIITASGGAFRNYSRDELKDVTIEDALKHPNWAMGKKITVDCASMVNKGLEVIEAHYLFDMPYDKIETILHFESIIHSMVAFNDGSIIAQMAKPDMRIPIQYAITYPKKEKYNLDSPLDINDVTKLSFKKMDFERYPMLKLAYTVGEMGGIMPLVYNASNEVANKLFVNNKISFLDIEKIIIDNVNYYKDKNIAKPSLEDILRINEEIKNRISLRF